VLQTAIDLLRAGYSVHLVADGCSSRSPTDRMFALSRLRQLGSVVTTHESVIFQLVGDKNHEKFKEVQALVKTLPSDTGLLALSQ
jgi:nicotinamidase-related amidase